LHAGGRGFESAHLHPVAWVLELASREAIERQTE
jgi:hypothetical protein